MKELPVHVASSLRTAGNSLVASPSKPLAPRRKGHGTGQRARLLMITNDPAWPQGILHGHGTTGALQDRRCAVVFPPLVILSPFGFAQDRRRKAQSKYGFFRIMSRCIASIERPRRIVRGPRGTDFPPHAPIRASAQTSLLSTRLQGPDLFGRTRMGYGVVAYPRGEKGSGPRVRVVVQSQAQWAVYRPCPVEKLWEVAS